MYILIETNNCTGTCIAADSTAMNGHRFGICCYVLMATHRILALDKSGGKLNCLDTKLLNHSFELTSTNILFVAHLLRGLPHKQ